jgi:two-component system OmpR family sensor kinase
MLFVGSEMNRLGEAKVEVLLKEKYLRLAGDFLSELSAGDDAALAKKIDALGFVTVELGHHREFSVPVYSRENPFGFLKILRHEDGRYLLNLRYLDQEIILSDRSQEEDFRRQTFLNILIFSDIAILVFIFIFVLRLLIPIKKISRLLVRFSEGAYGTRITEVSNDEIGQLAGTFNTMAERIEALIKSREALLRDISHELKTPIAKGKLALEMVPPGEYKAIIQKAFVTLDELTGELLSLEKLKSGSEALKHETFGVETLIIESLGQLYIEDESLVKVEIRDFFTIKGDRRYLIIALKNLLENGLKYGTKKPLVVRAEKGSVAVMSYGEKLQEGLEHYLELFTQGESSRGKGGYGIGLNIVKTVLEKHGFGLEYVYEEEQNVFTIDFR